MYRLRLKAITDLPIKVFLTPRSPFQSRGFYETTFINNHGLITIWRFCG